MRKSLVVASCLLAGSTLIVACVGGNAGGYGVELDGHSTAPFTETTTQSDKPYNIVGECLLAEYSNKYPASGITYRDLTASKQVRLWFNLGTDGILPSATTRLFDIKVIDSNGHSTIRAIAANHLFGTYMDDIRPAIEQCK